MDVCPVAYLDGSFSRASFDPESIPAPPMFLYRAWPACSGTFRGSEPDIFDHFFLRNIGYFLFYPRSRSQWENLPGGSAFDVLLSSRC